MENENLCLLTDLPIVDGVDTLILPDQNRNIEVKRYTVNTDKGEKVITLCPSLYRWLLHSNGEYPKIVAQSRSDLKKAITDTEWFSDKYLHRPKPDCSDSIKDLPNHWHIKDFVRFIDDLKHFDSFLLFLYNSTQFKYSFIFLNSTRDQIRQFQMNYGLFEPQTRLNKYIKKGYTQQLEDGVVFTLAGTEYCKNLLDSQKN